MKFAELYAGQSLVLGTHEVSEQDIVEYARRFDPQPFHVDADEARKSRWQGLIASGFHTCAIAMRLVADNILRGSESMGSPGLDYLKWPRPVRGGDRLGMRVEVLETSRSKSGRVGVVRWRWLLSNQHGEIVLDLVASSLFSLKEANEP